MDPKGQPMYPERVEIRNLRSDELSKNRACGVNLTSASMAKTPTRIAWEHEGQLMMMLCVPELTEAGLRYQYSSPTGDGFLADAKLNSYKESAFRKEEDGARTMDESQSYRSLKLSYRGKYRRITIPRCQIGRAGGETATILPKAVKYT